MLMGDILSLKQFNLPVKIVVFSNSSLAFADIAGAAACWGYESRILENSKIR